MMNTNILNINNWLPLDTFIEKHPQFTANQLRWMIRNSKHNGFDTVHTKIGRRIYICENSFGSYLEKDAESAGRLGQGVRNDEI